MTSDGGSKVSEGGKIDKGIKKGQVLGDINFSCFTHSVCQTVSGCPALPELLAWMPRSKVILDRVSKVIAAQRFNSSQLLGQIDAGDQCIGFQLP